VIIFLTFGLKLFLILKNKAVFLFLIKFFVTYLILSGLYQFYLTKNNKNGLIKTDFITKQVAYHTIFTGKTFGYSFKTEPNIDEASMKLIINDKYVARVVEGCNAVSVMILFWAFIIAFTGKWYETLLFGLIGILLIYFINIARIFLLTLAIDRYPQYSTFLHKIVFPAIIYGFTFLLWMIWVKRVENRTKVI